MLLLRIWNYIRGYVIILVEGYFYEKFMNICARRQIFLWDIKRCKDGVLTLKVSIKGFKLLRPIVKKTDCRVRILKKQGVPFILNRYRKRKTFLIGAVFFILLIYVLTSFIWAIEVDGNKRVETKLIVDRLAETGIKPGAVKYGIDTDRAVNDMMMHVKELAWISITLKGTKVKVHVAERKPAPVLVPTDEPCDIVARRDGVIKSITAKDGMKMVKVGDTVTKGQVLVSGSIPVKDENAGPRLVHSIASVKARTWYEGDCPVYTVITEKQRTGRKKDRYSLNLFEKRIPLFHGSVGFEEYDRVEFAKRLSFGEDLVLPFEIVIERFLENRVVETEIDMEEAMEIASEKAFEEAVKDIPDDAAIVKTDVNFKETEDGGIRAVAMVECVEEIGVEQMNGGN